MNEAKLLDAVAKLVTVLYNGQMKAIGEVSPATQELKDLMDEHWRSIVH